MYVCMYFIIYVCMHACMHVCMYVCVCVCVCMYVCIHMHTYKWIRRSTGTTGNVPPGDRCALGRRQLACHSVAGLFLSAAPPSHTLNPPSTLQCGRPQQKEIDENRKNRKSRSRQNQGAVVWQVCFSLFLSVSLCNPSPPHTHIYMYIYI